MCNLSDGVYDHGYNDKTLKVVKNLLKAAPDWPDDKIANIVQDISPEEVAKLRDEEKHL